MTAVTLSEVVRRQADGDPEGLAYTFLAGTESPDRSITWAQLEARATNLGERLRTTGATGEPVLLALHSGLEFIESLFACWYAGAIPVPVNLPRQNRFLGRINAIVANSGVRFAVGTAASRSLLGLSGQGTTLASPLTWIDAGSDASTVALRASNPRRTDVALLQYTSGSTGTPRGVVVTHENLISNSQLIADACSHRRGDVIAGWLPLFHDMGLIGLVVQAVVAGVHCVLMAPERFLMRPWVWLQMISDYRACSSPAPNFAYDLCVERVGPERQATLDLSSWRNALNGSEPVRAATLERFAAAFAPCGFRRSAFFPCYGLAEATLFVTGPREPRTLVRRRADGSLLRDQDGGGHVGCGKPPMGTQAAIVNPGTRRCVPDGEVGEIWVCGKSVAQGYWHDAEATAATFHGRLDDDPSARNWLRTGDLGFLDASGELFITGRLRELIIVAGRNHFPIDIERTAELADPGIAASSAVAFSTDLEGAERLIVVAEVRRGLTAGAGANAELDVETMCRRIRAAVSAENEVTPYDVVMLRAGAVPRTSSGKVQRLATRQAYLQNTLKRLEVAAHVS